MSKSFFLLLVIMCALSPCCKAQFCKKVVVTSSTNKQTANQQLSQIEKNRDCIMIGTDSYNSGNDEYIIEAYGPKTNHRPQIVDRTNWDEFERKNQKYRNKKNPGMDWLTFKVWAFEILNTYVLK